jgi:hypothetical protein
LDASTEMFSLYVFSKAENTIPADVAERSPGFNPLLCCQGKKHAYYRAGQPLRNLKTYEVYSAKDTLKVKNIQTLMSPCSDVSILRNTLTSGKEDLHVTASSVTKMNSDVDSGKVHLNIPVSSTSNLLQSVSVVTTQAPSYEDKSAQQLMAVTNSSSTNASECAIKISDLKTPAKPGYGMIDSTLLASQKQPSMTYESAFLNHLAQTGVQNQTPLKNQSSRHNTAVPVTGCVTGGNHSATLHSSGSLKVVQVPVSTVMFPRASSIPGPAVNKVYINKNVNSNNPLHTLPSSKMSTAQHIQSTTGTPLSMYCIVSRSPYEVPNLVPMSHFQNPPVMSAGHTQLMHPPFPDMTVQKNIRNIVSENTCNIRDKNLATVVVVDDDDDIIEVFSNVQNSCDSPKAECEWMIKALRKTDRTSKILAYNVEVLRQRFVSEIKGEEVSAKGMRQLARKFHHLLVKASKRLNFEKEFLSKEFSDWFNAEKAKHGIPAEKAKHGIPATEERGLNSSPSNDNVPDVETTREPELLLDMDISCESDQEDVSSPDRGAKQALIECTENFSDSDSDAEDPFSDSEDTEKKKVNPVFKPFFSLTIREVLRDTFRSKLLLQLLTDHHSEMANMQNKNVSHTKGLQFTDVSTQTDVPRGEVTVEEMECKITQNKSVSSTEEIQFIDVSTQTDAPRREEFTVGEKECKITQNKSVSSTEEIQFIDVSTQTDAHRREEFTVEEKESTIKQKKSVSSTEEVQFIDVLTQTDAPSVEEETSTNTKLESVWSGACTDFLTVNESEQSSSNSSVLSLHSENITTGLGTKNEKHVKRKYQGTKPRSDVSSDVQTDHSHDSPKSVVKRVRINNQNCDSSSLRVVIPERTKMASKIPDDFKALTNYALHKKIIKPCFVSIVKVNRSH